MFNRKDEYQIKVDIDIDEALKDIRKVKEEVKECVKETSFEIKKLNLKWRDTLVVKVNGLLKEYDQKMIEKKLKKKLHRKVLVIDSRIDLSVLQK